MRVFVAVQHRSSWSSAWWLCLRSRTLHIDRSAVLSVSVLYRVYERAVERNLSITVLVVCLLLFSFYTRWLLSVTRRQSCSVYFSFSSEWKGGCWILLCVAASLHREQSWILERKKKANLLAGGTSHLWLITYPAGALWRCMTVGGTQEEKREKENESQKVLYYSGTEGKLKLWFGGF